MTESIPGLKLIQHNAAGINRLDDPSFPFRLEVSLRPPEFLGLAFVAIHGGQEEVVVRGMTRKVLDTFVDMNRFRTHPRLLSITITGPSGVEWKFPEREKSRK